MKDEMIFFAEEPDLDIGAWISEQNARREHAVCKRLAEGYRDAEGLGETVGSGIADAVDVFSQIPVKDVDSLKDPISDRKTA